MKDLLISVDPGFDSMKVIANGIAFKFPFNAVRTDEAMISNFAIQDDFIMYRDDLGATYRVGSYAREMIFDKKTADPSELTDFYTEDRFLTEEFKVGLRCAIAMAINSTGLYADQADLNIYLMLALPHACRQQFAASLVGSAVGQHKFALRIGNAPIKDFSYTVTNDHVFTISQTIAAILGETSDIDGNIADDKFKYLSDGPTLVIDGGYYTTGIVMVSRGGSVDDAMTESNTDFAMKNVNMAVVEAVKAHRPDLRHYMIEYMLDTGNTKIKYMNAETKKAETLDIRNIRKEKIAKICQGLIQHLNERYNDLLDINYVLVTGGTGAKFYPHLSRYYEEHGIMDKEHMLLTGCELGDKKLSIEYAIAIGGYKGLRGSIA